jgi:hypothetical protein
MVINMLDTNKQVDMEIAKKWLSTLLCRQLTEEKISWLENKQTALDNTFSEKNFYLSFSLVSRHIGKKALKLSASDYKEAEALRAGFSPINMTMDQAARIFLLLHIPSDDFTRYNNVLDNLFATAEIHELLALHRALPLLPHPQLLIPRCTEGIRTNMTVVFDAVALHNPYPADFIDENAWNQMVLKAVFMERPLDKIVGLDSRANSTLAVMLTDFARERRAANRTVTPELWRPIGPFIANGNMDEFELLFNKGTQLEREAAALACSQSPFTKAASLLSKYPKLKSKVENKEINWHSIAEKWFELRA